MDKQWYNIILQVRSMYAKCPDCGKEAEGKYAAILVPQNITRHQPLIEILSGNVSYLLESRLNLKSGVEHKLNITLNSDTSKVRIDIGGEVQGWS